MKKILNKMATSIKSVHWATPKDVIGNTCITVITASILTALIFGWNQLIEHAVNLVISLF